MADRIVHIEDGKIVGTYNECPGQKDCGGNLGTTQEEKRQVNSMLANNNRGIIKRMAGNSLRKNGAEI